MSNASDAGVKCPICGADAEAGCIYGADKSPLWWAAGPPTMKTNIETALGGGDPVGQWGSWSGSYVEGVRCRRCRRIIVSG